MKQLTFRLHQNQLLKEEIERRTTDVDAGILLSIVGAVENANLRMAGSTPDSQIMKTFDGPLEIVSGTGTISRDGCHIHVSFSDKEGKVIGGHLKDGCRVALTAEVVIGIFDDVIYQRTPDENTGFKELDVKQKA